MSDETLCLSFLFTCVFLPIVGMWAFSWLSGNRNTPAGTYPPQRTVEDIARSYDPTGAMATQRTDYGDVNEVARVAYDHANGGTGAGVTGKVVVYDSDYNQHETGEYIKVIQKVAHQGNNNLTIERRRGNRP